MTARRCGLATRAIHSPSAGAEPGTPLVGPIVLSTTFSFETAAEFGRVATEFGRVATEEERGYLYARMRNPTVDELNAVDTGGILDPFPAFLLRRGLKTLTLRMDAHCRNAIRLAGFLEAHSKVKRVFYPGLESYPQHELARRQLDGFGGMLAVEVTGGREGGEHLMDGLRLAARATSLGGVDTVVHHPAATSHRQYSAEQLAEAGISAGLVRVSVGCEDADDIVDDFDRALAEL